MVKNLEIPFTKEKNENARIVIIFRYFLTKMLITNVFEYVSEMTSLVMRLVVL